MSESDAGKPLPPHRALGRSRTLLAVAIAGAVTLLDQASKLWADRALAGSPPVEIVENFFHLVHHRNTGGVFGILAGEPTLGRRIFFIAVSAVALGFVVHLIRQWGRESLAGLVGLALVAGGAVGNLIDRVAYGKVIDFIDWHWYGHHWPTFNIADSAITCGTLILAFALFRPSGRKPAVAR